jgi:hypothetical protein
MVDPAWLLLLLDWPKPVLDLIQDLGPIDNHGPEILRYQLQLHDRQNRFRSNVSVTFVLRSDLYGGRSRRLIDFVNEKIVPFQSRRIFCDRTTAAGVWLIGETFDLLAGLAELAVLDARLLPPS